MISTVLAPASSGTQSPPPTIGAHTCALLVHEAVARGHDGAAILRAARLPEHLDAAPDLGVPVHKAVRLARLVTQLTGDPAVGLAAGRRAKLGDLGLIGALLRSSPDFDSALQAFLTWTGSPRLAWGEMELRRHPDGVGVLLRPTAVPLPRALHDLFLSAAWTLGEQVLGELTPAAVRLGLRRPSDAPHEQFFGRTVTYGARATELVLPVEAISRALPFGDPVLAGMVAQHVTPLPRRTTELDVVSAVREALTRNRFASVPTLPEVAAQLAMSPRTLRRRLAQEGTNFVTLLDDARREIALELLAEADAPSGVDIAARLGYTDMPAFYRAFKRWTGIPLSTYRASATSAVLPVQ